MTPAQKKEREALNDALMWQKGKLGYYPYRDKHNEAPMDTLMKYPQLYADHYEEIQALKSGEWVLVPSEPDRNMRIKGFGKLNFNKMTAEERFNEIASIFKAMIAARPNVKENDDE